LRLSLSLERRVAPGAALVVVGLGLALYSFFFWYELSFGEILSERLIKLVCGASLLTVLGFKLVFDSFLLNLLNHPAETQDNFSTSQPTSPSRPIAHSSQARASAARVCKMRRGVRILAIIDEFPPINWRMPILMK
jgi:hypothetical protein